LYGQFGIIQGAKLRLLMRNLGFPILHKDIPLGMVLSLTNDMIDPGTVRTPTRGKGKKMQLKLPDLALEPHQLIFETKTYVL